MISVALLFFFLMIILLPIVHANPLSMGLAGTYQNNAPPGSLDGARGMQVDAVRSIAFVSSNTDASLTAINFSNPFNLSVYGSVTNAAPPGSLDGIWFGTLDLATNIFYAPSATDSTTAWYNISTGTFVFLNDTAADTAGAGSQQGEYDVVIVNTGSTKWLLTGGTTDSYVSSFNVTNPRVRPTVVGSFTDTSGACTVRGLTQMYNIPGTTLVVVASTTSSYVTVLNVSAAGAITCIGSGYTDTAGAGSIQGFTSFFYENSTGYLYVPGTTDSYLTILTNITTGTPTLVGSVGGLTTITSVAVSPTDFNGKKYAFVGSTSAGRGISIVDVTNPAAPTIAGNFNQTSGTCVYNGVYSLRALGNYLYATSSADACFYAIKLIDDPTNITLSSPYDGYYNDTDIFVNLTFTAAVSDTDGLVNCSLWTNYSGVWSLNQTQSVGGVSNSTSFTLNNLSNTTFIWNIQCFDNGLHSTFGSTNRTVILNWTPPLVGNFSVQTYFISLGSGVSSGFIPFIGGQTDFNAVPFVTMRMSATTPNWNYFLPDVYFNSTGIIVTRNGGTGAVMDLNINVVQFDPATVRVQSGIFTLGAGSTSATASIGSPVDLSRAALLFYYNTTSGSTIYNSNTVMGNISDVNQLNFSVAGTVGTKSGHWYVFESLDGGFSVQKTTLNFASSDTSATGTISFIDTGKTFLIASYITSEAQDDPRDGSLYVALTDSTTVTGTRLGVPVATLNANVYAITFSGNVNVQRGYFSYAAGTGTASATVSTFNLNNSMAWNPVLTSRMADSSTTTAIESSFQLLNLSSSTTIDGSRSETAGAAGGEWEIIDWIPLHAPTVDSMTVDDGLAPSGEVILSAGSTRPVNCTIAASDIEGASAIMNASATFYYYLNKSSDPNDNTVHYTNASCSVVGSNATSKIFFCAFDVYYYANNGTWNCNATVYNIYSYFSSSNASVTIDPLYAVHLTDGLNFGPVEAGFSSSEFATNITNLGNMPLNITVQGYAQTPGDAMGMNCSDLTNISISAIGFSGTSGSFTSKTLLTGAVQMTNLQLSKQTSALPINQSVYWQIVPTPAVGSSTRTCEGYIIFSGETQ